MTNRLNLRAFRLPLWALAPFAPLALAVACGDSDESAPPAPPGPIAIAIQELLPRGAEHWHLGDPQPVTLGCDRRLGVTVDFYDPVAKAQAEEAYERLMDASADVEVPPPGPPPDGDWLLRTAGACGGHEQCGTLAVIVEPVGGGPSARAQAALATVLVDLAPLGDAAFGPLRIRVELRENGVAQQPFQKNGVPVVDEIEVAFAPDDCAPGGDAGAGGMPSGTGGSPATGGNGGSSGTGNRGGEGGVGATGGTGQGGGGHGGEAGSPAGTGGAPGGAAGEAGAGP